MKESALANQVTPRTLWDSASKNLSRCNMRDTSGLLEPHLTRFILAFDMISHASWTMLQNSSMESASDRKSSTYIFSCNSANTRDEGNEAKWDKAVASKRKGYCSFRKELIWISSPWCLHLHPTKNDAHLVLLYTHLSREKLCQFLQWWQAASDRTKAKSLSDSSTSIDQFPYNRLKRCHCNSWQMRRKLVWPWLSQQYLIPQADVACKRQDQKYAAQTQGPVQ